MKRSALRALAEGRQQLGVRSDVQARLESALTAPRTPGLRPAQFGLIIPKLNIIFMLRGCRKAT